MNYPGIGAHPAQQQAMGSPSYPGAVPGTPPGVVDQPQLPPNYDARLGNVQAIAKRHYDTILVGIGETWDPQGEEFWTNNNRVNDRFRCSLKEPGKFSDKKEFHTRAIGLTLEFSNPSLYELFHYQLITYQYQEALKWRIWADQLAAGGGVYGYDVNNAAFHLNWGSPDTENLHHLDEPLIFSVERTFKMIGEWATLNNEVAANQPLNILNADETARKLYRIFMVGVEIGDEANR